jgi:hypothetical protein
MINPGPYPTWAQFPSQTNVLTHETRAPNSGLRSNPSPSPKYEKSSVFRIGYVDTQNGNCPNHSNLHPILCSPYSVRCTPSIPTNHLPFHHPILKHQHLGSGQGFQCRELESPSVQAIIAVHVGAGIHDPVLGDVFSWIRACGRPR